MFIDRFDDLEFFGNAQHDSYSAMAIGTDLLGHALSQPFQKGLSSAEILQDNGSWFPVDPARLHYAPIGMPPGGSFLESSHISVYIT
jgi:hypothetical protein